MNYTSVEEDLKSSVDNLQKLVIQQKDPVVPKKDYSFEKADLPRIAGSDRHPGKQLPPSQLVPEPLRPASRLTDSHCK